MDDPMAVLAARARLALRAERAFGADAVLLPRGTGFQPVRATPEVEGPARPQAPARRHGLEARVTVKSPEPEAAKPTLDLFGNPAVKPGDPSALPAFEGPPPPRGRRIELLQAMDDGEVKGCTKCDLSQTRTHTVFGEGDPEAAVMFVGEGPGENEDLTGRPFVGKAGGLLDKMIAGMGLKREDVYIANVVKCRPPNNRVPTAGEVAACTPYLDRQIEWIRPRVVVTLGLPATKHLLGLNLPMSRMRGQWHEWRGVKVMPTYHPAYLLRSYTEANRRAVWDDLRLVMAEVGLAGPGKKKGR